MITLYSTGCPNCNILKMKLDKFNIEYDVENNMSKIVELGFRSAPMLDVDGKLMTFVEATQWLKGL